MATEVACSECGGRLLIDAPDVVVACPHCSAHLMLPDETAAEPIATPTDAAATAQPAEGDLADVDSSEPPRTAPSTDGTEPMTEPPTAEPQAVWDGPQANGSPSDTGSGPDFSSLAAHEPAVPWAPPAEGEAESDFPDFEAAASARSEGELEAATASAVLTAAEAPGPTDASAWPARDETAPPDSPPDDSLPAADSEQSAEGETEAGPGSFFEAAGASAEQSPLVSGKRGAAVKPAVGVSRNLFLIVLSYASAVTLAFLYLLLTSLSADPHQLESLPDIEPPMKDEEILPVFIPQNAPMPKGHTLQLGETQRFGNLEVTPLRVTREPLEFVHFSDASKTRPAGPPVLKLWLRFRNVSKEQPVKPLGKGLVYNRFPHTEDITRDRANNFIARLSDKEGGPVVLIHNLVVEDVWDLKAQDVERRLQPGETLETYLPSSDEGLGALTGKLVWRVHFRKGHNPESGRGVTTLIEVVFDDGEIRT